MSQPCAACGQSGAHPQYEVREMQLGLRETFTYQHCGHCGCMQLLDVPADLGRFYPNESYYSFTSGRQVRPRPDRLRALRTAYLLYGKRPLIGALLAAGYRVPEYLDWVKVPQVGFRDRILDVGTGNGSLLFDLHKNGFTNLTGIDPFLAEETVTPSVQILRKEIFDMEGTYDYIMMHHVFEHMSEPLRVLQKAYALLQPGRFLLVRTPVMGGYGWQHYGTDWVGLDAPRHLIIHTADSVRLLAQQAGFELRHLVFDANAYHLWASEQYRDDIPLMAPDSYMVDRQRSRYGREDIRRFDAIAHRANGQGQGDQAAFYLFKR